MKIRLAHYEAQQQLSFDLSVPKERISFENFVLNRNLFEWHYVLETRLGTHYKNITPKILVELLQEAEKAEKISNEMHPEPPKEEE